MAYGPQNARVKVILDDTKKFFEALEELTSKSVFVGVPSTRVGRKPVEGEVEPANNAVIGYVMENGDPEHNIPPRPFLVPSVKGVQPQIVSQLKAISRAAFDSDLSKVRSLRLQLGLFAQHAVQQKITDGPFVPLAQATLEARARRGRRGAKAELKRRALGLAPGTDLARPLIDTGQLRRSISYVVGPNKSRRATIRAMTGDWPTFLGTKK